jgi:hypothetical protein
MRKILILSALLLSGCAHVVPIAAPFPTPPEVLLQGCENLNTLQPDPKLSDLMTVVAENYTKYHVCRQKNQAWRDWYATQKSIYNSSIKK